MRTAAVLAKCLLAACLLLGGAAQHTAARAAPAAGVVGDGTPGSCTDAALDAVLAPGGLVTFDCGPDAVTIPIATKAITTSVTLDGGGLVTLSGSHTHQLFTVAGGARLELHNLTLADGHNPSGQGGAVLSAGTLVVSGSRFLSNTTVIDGLGGAISSSGALTITGSAFSDNRATGGGALYTAGPAWISATTFVSNTAGAYGGGAVFDHQGGTTLSGITFTGNTAAGSGGALRVLSATVTLTGVVAGGNSAFSGGVLAVEEGAAVLADSVLSGNSAFASGGGLFSAAAVVTLTRTSVGQNLAHIGAGLSAYDSLVSLSQTTVASNRAAAEGGGLYASGGDVSLLNSTLSANTAQSGGGLYSLDAGLDLGHVTFYGNAAGTGGGLYQAGAGGAPSLVAASVLANSPFGGNCHVAPSASLGSGGDNLSSDGTCGAHFNQPGDQNGVDPRLGPLGDNGGPTLTHLPRLGSPALDQGSLACPPADQRGVARPQGPACDLGAVERRAADVDVFLLLLPFTLR